MSNSHRLPLSDVEEKGYCDFSSSENEKMSINLACVKNDRINEFYRKKGRDFVLVDKLIAYLGSRLFSPMGEKNRVFVPSISPNKILFTFMWLEFFIDL